MIFWRCENRKCPARGHSKSFKIPFEAKNEHNHCAIPEKLEKLIAKNNLKTRAVNSRDNPRSIIIDSCKELSREASALGESQLALKQVIKRIRHKNKSYGKNPSNLDQIEIPEDLQKTFKGKKFY